MNTRFLLIGGAFFTTIGLNAADKHAFNVTGVYSEACNCSIPCACEMTGLMKGCEGVGALQITSGKYNGQDLSGIKAAYATAPGEWVRLYLQVAKPEQKKAAREFLSAVYGGFGKIEEIKDAKIDISGTGGNYTVVVDDGNIMKYQTKAVLGGDQKTPLSHSNVGDPLNKTFLQAQNESCTYKDAGHQINLEKGRNSYFNDKMKAAGEI